MRAVNQYYRALSRGGAGSLYDLSAESGWLHCYSFAKRFPAYSGACLRIIRDSDSAELDIPFENDLIKVSDINSHCSGTTGRVKIWYDQFGSNNWNGIGTVRPIIYSGGAFLGYVSSVGIVAGFEFSSNFNTAQNFAMIMSFRRGSDAYINKRSSAPNAGMLLNLTAGSSNNGQATYYGVAAYTLPTAKTNLKGDLTVKKYIGLYNNNNVNVSGHAYVEGIDSDLLTSLGSVSVGTQVSASTVTKFGLNLLSSGAINTALSGNINFTELFLFSSNQTANTNIFDKRYIP